VEATVPSGGETPERRLKFNYIKTANFRAIAVDGVIGGLTPTGRIQMVPWTERLPIPQQVVNQLLPAERGAFTIGEEVLSERVCRPGLIRDTEVCLMIDLKTAEQMVKWLHERIEEARGATSKPETE